MMDESHIIAVGSKGYLYLGDVTGASARSVEGLELYIRKSHSLTG